jgi:hypothetical protein
MKGKYISLLFFLFFLLSCEKEKSVGYLKIPAGTPASFVKQLPRPVLTEHDYLLKLYWKGWELLEQNIGNGTSYNGLVSNYLNEGYDELIHQWDTCFLTMFAIYGGDLFPSMVSLDNFYNKQRSDGWICGTYRESDGEAVDEPSGDNPQINPPLFSWVEWKYYLLTGDRSRLSRVLFVLDNYYNWIDSHCGGQLAAGGLYYNTLTGNRMDNSPREGIDKGGWIDLSAQMALFAKYMMFMAREVQNEELKRNYEQRYRLLIRTINGKMWDSVSNFYYDINIRAQKISTKTVASFWTLISEVATFPQARQLAEHLQNPEEFYRNHLFPSLSADDTHYNANGQYWCGGVWAPINYMIIKGLDIYPLRELAAVAALNHLENLFKVYQNFTPDTAKIFNYRAGTNYNTIWECYSPEYPSPATKSDGQYLSQQESVVTSGLGPIALLLENVIGLQPSAPRDELRWDLRLQEKHGVENYRFGDNTIDIICESNQLPVGSASIWINTTSPFKLIVSSRVGIKEFEIVEGKNEFEIGF